MIHAYHTWSNKSLNYLAKIVLAMFCLFSSFSYSQNIVVETLNTLSGDPFPYNNMCPNIGRSLGVKFKNTGGSAILNKTVTITVLVTAPDNTTQTFSQNWSGISIATNTGITKTFTATVDMHLQGMYDFAMVATYAGDVPPGGDGYDLHEQVFVVGNVIGLTSSLATTSQNICKNSALDTIFYDVSYNGTDATATGLPAGVTYSFNYPTLKIFGKPTTTVGSPYAYAVTATGSCPTKDDSTLVGTVTVKDLPVVAYLGNDTICEGFASSVSPNSLGTWTSSSPTIASITNTGAITGLSAGKTLLTYTKTATGCHDTLRKFTVNPLPIVNAITGTTNICIGTTTQLANTTVGGTWSSSSTNIATVNPSTGLVSGISDGFTEIDYTVVSLGCTTVVSTIVTVNALPAVSTTSGIKHVCVGMKTKLTNSTAIGVGVWSIASPAVASINNGLVTGVAAGKTLVSYTVTDINGCISSDTTTIRVYAFPTVAPITGIKTICEDVTTQLADATPTGVWSSLNTGVATINSLGLVTPVSAGQSIIKYVVTTNGCATTVKDTLTVNALPIVDPIAGSTNVCVGATSQLTNTTPGGVWSSFTTAVATINSTGLVSGLTPGTTLIDYTVTILGCTSKSSETVSTFSMPSVNPITGNTTVCAEATSQLSNTTLGGVWTSGTPANATISANGLVTGIKAGTSLITYAVTVNGCTTISNATVSVTALPVVPAITGSASVCEAATTKFTNTTAGGTWSSDTPSVATIDPTTGTITGVSAGTASISYLVTQVGCSKTVTKTITVNPLPIVASITGTKQVCIGLTTPLTNATATGVWSSGSTSVATISGTGLVTGKTAGSSLISYTVTDVNGCVNTDTTTIQIYAFPVVAAISGTTTLCELASTQLANTTANGVWSSGTTSVATIDVNGLVTAIKAGTSSISYVVTTNNCATTVNSTITVNALPIVVPITGSTNVCVGATSQLTNTIPGGVWTSLTPAVATINSSGLVSGLTPGTSQIDYTVTILGCSTTKSTIVNTFSMPSVNPIAGLTTICAGASTKFTSTTPSGVWSSGSTNIATIDTAGLATGISGGSSIIGYAVTINGCTTTRNVTLNVTPLPVVPAITGSSSVCVAATTTYSNTTAGGTWSSDTPSIATIDPTTGTITGVSAGTATISYTVTQVGCSKTVTKSITVNPLPIVASITGTKQACIGLTTPLTNATAAGVWSSGSTSVATISGTGLVTGKSAGSSVISYTVTDVNGCFKADTATVRIYAFPVVAAITGTTTLCELATTQLANTTANGIWSSGTTSVATIDVNGLVTAIKVGTSSISYVVTTNNCATTVNSTITVNALPIVAAVTGSSIVCMGKTTQLACVTPSGVWSSASANVASVDANGLVTGLISGSSSVISYAVTANGCTSTSNFTITVNPMPVVSSITGNLTVCSGLTSQLANVTVNGVWTSASPAIATISNTGLVTGVTGGSSQISYAVTINGCTTTQNATVIVVNSPVVPAITGNTVICVNATSILANTTTDGVWTSDSTAYATINSSTGEVTGIKAGISLIRYTVNANGCSTEKTKSVTIKPLPTITRIIGATNVCVGATTPLSNVTPTGIWSSSDPLVASVNGTGVVTGVKPGAAVILYTVTSGGCSNTSSTAIAVNALPIVAPIEGNTTFCSGNVSQLTCLTPKGSWSSNNPTVVTVDQNGMLSGLTFGTSIVSYAVSENGCTTTNTAIVTINASPMVADITGGSTMCMGATLQLASATTDGTWKSASLGVATVNTAGLITSTGPGTSVITYSKTIGICTTTKKDTIRVFAMPVVSPITGKVEICAGSSTQLENETLNGVWSSSIPGIASIDGFGMVIGINAGSSTISYAVSENNCTTTVTTNVNITGALKVSPISGNTTVCENATTLLEDATPGGKWSSSTASIASIDSITGLVSGKTPGTSIITYSVVTNGVCPQFAQTTITVNQVPTVNAITDKTVCEGSMVNGITFTGNSTPTYQWTNSNTAIGLASSGTGNISAFKGTGTTLGGPAQTAVINVIPNMGGCVGTPKSFFITIKSLENPAFSYNATSYCNLDADPFPTVTGTTGGTFTALPAGLALNPITGVVNLAGSKDGYYSVKYTTGGTCSQDSTVLLSISNNPSVNVTSDQSVCEGTNFNAVNFAGNPGSLFNWTNSNSTIGLSTNGSGNIASFKGTGTIASGSSVLGIVVVTPFAGSCIGKTDTFQLQVNAKDNASFTYPSNSFCTTLDANPIANITGKTGGVFSASPNGLTLNPSTGLITLASSTPGAYLLTYTTNGTCPNSSSLNLTLGDNPSVNSIISQSKCIGTSFDPINFTGSAGTSFNWVNNTPSIGLAASGSGNIAAFSGTGVSVNMNTLSSTVTVTPRIGSCIGSTKTFTLTLNYSDNVGITYSDNSYCAADVNPTPTISGATGGVFSATPNGLTIDALTGKIDIITSTEGFYNVMYRTTGVCADTAIVPVGISFNPAVNTILGQTVCAGTSFTPTSFTGSPGSVFDWKNSNTSLGLATSGTGDIPSFVSINTSKSAIQGTVTVTPRAGSCKGTPKSFDLKVNPVDDATFSYTAASFCSNAQDITPTITGTAAGTFSAMPVTGISLNPTSGKIAISSSSPGIYNITYLTPGVCPKVSSTVVKINPEPVVNSVSNQIVCQNANFNSINFSGTSSTLFNWTNSNTSIGLASSGTGSISSFKASGTYKGGNPETAILQVTPSIGVCLGTPISVVLTVNNFDNPAFAYSDNSYCKSQVNPIPSITGATGGNFTVSPIGLDLDNVSGAINLANSTSGTYAITYTTNGNCPIDSTVNIAVGNDPIVDAITDQTKCEGVAFSTIAFSGNPGTVFDWTNTNTAIGLSASGTGDIQSFNATGTIITASDIYGTITVTPRMGSCVGSPKTFKLTVNALDNANFSYSNTSFCKTQANPSPSINGLSGGTFSSLPAGIAMNSSGVIDLISSLSGTYMVSYTTHGKCPNVNSVPMSIGNAPTVNTVADQTVCAGSNFHAISFTGALGSVYTWTNNNSAIGLASAGTGNINSFTSVASGVSNITVTPSVGACIGSPKTFKLTVNGLQPTTVSYPQTSYCLNQVNPSPTISGPTGGNYSAFPFGLSVNPTNGVVDLANSTPGNYVVTYAINGIACASNATTSIAVGENPTVNAISSQTVCTDVNFNTVIFSGNTGTQFSWANTNSAIGLAATGTGNIPSFTGTNSTNNSIAGNITVTPMIGTCVGTAKMFVLTVKPSDDASFSYSSNKYCADASNPTPTILGTSGGTFTSNLSSITLSKTSGKITLGTSTPGTYNITYLTSGACPKASTEVITLVPLPIVNSISDQTVCDGSNFNTVIFTGSPNTQFDWTNSKTSIGLLASGVSDITAFKARGTTPNGPSVTGKIVVTPKINGCIGTPTSFDLTVNSMDAPYFSYPKNSICQLDANPTPIITGTTGGVFTSTPVGLSLTPSTGKIIISTSTVNTYTVKYTTTGSCVKDSSISIVINPTAFVNPISSQQRCQDDSFNPIIFSGSANTIYKWTNSNTVIGLADSGEGNIPSFIATGTVFGGVSILGNVLVTPEINGCTGATKSFNLSVNPIDNPAFAYSDNSFCAVQANPTPTITGTPGGTFSYSPSGLVINTFTGEINLLASTPNNYLIKYTTAGNCKDDSTVSIGVGGNPSLDDIDDQDVCEGTSFDPVVFTGNPGSVFSWTNANATVGIPTTGNTNIPAYVAKGVVNYRDTLAQMIVTSRIGTCIGNSVNFKYRVRAKPHIQGRIVQTPLTSKLVKDTAVCKGSNIKLIATGITKNADYHWSPNTALLGFQSSGASVTTNLDSTQQFVITGQNQFGCSNTDSVIVRVYNPKVVSSHKDTTVCSGITFNGIIFKGNTPTPTFTWTNTNTSIGLGASGSGNITPFIGKNVSANQIQSATITVTPKYTIPTSGAICTGTPTSIKLNVNKLDNPSFTGYLSQYCSNETASTIPTISGTKNGVFTSLPTGLVLNPISGQLFPTASLAKSYFVKYSTTGVCPKSDSMSLTIKPLLTASIAGEKTVCRDAAQPIITFKGANGTAPYTFKYTINGGAIKQITSAVSTDSVTLSVSTANAGTFVYALVGVEESSASQCSNGVSGSVTINVNTLPIAQLSGTATVCEGGTSPNVTFTGVNGTSPFTFTYAINGLTQPSISTKTGEYSVNVAQPTTTSATYTYSLIGIKDGSSLACYQPQNTSATISVKKLPTATIKASIKSVCIDGTGPTITFAGANGVQPYTFEYKVNGVSNYISSNSNSFAVIDVPTNAADKYVYELVSVKDGGQYSCKNTNISGKDSVEVIPGAFVNPLEDVTVCKGNNSGLITFTGSSNTTFNWYTNNTTTGLVSTGKDSIGNFKGLNTSTNTPNISLVTVTPSKGVCKGKAITFKILVRPNPDPKTSPVTIICPGDSLLIKGITPNGISPDYQYIWTPDATLSCLDCPQVWAKPTKTTDYTFIAKDAFGCIGKDKFTMLVRDTPLIQGKDTTLCGETSAIILKGTGGISYVWSNGIVDGQPFTPNFGINKYAVTGKDTYNCISTDTVIVSVLTQPKASFTLSTNEVFAAPNQPASILITNTSKDATKYVFNYGNGEPLVTATSLEPKTAIYQYPGIATVELVVYNGACADAYSLPIIIKKIDTTSIVKLPNVFTPNGDGDNDEFMIVVKNAKTLHLTIFNRWGNPIHEITDTAPTWDGKINGYLAAEGVYFYEYTIETQNGPPMKGNGYVQLIRK